MIQDHDKKPQTSILRRREGADSETPPVASHTPSAGQPGVSKSILRRPDHNHPFAAFAADDLAAIERLFESGFDAAWLDPRGLTCVMEAASRGNVGALHLALSRAADPAALVLVKSPAGIDAFDMAAAAGSATCMWEISRHLPDLHRSAIGRGLMWHAVEAHAASPTVADVVIAQSDEEQQFLDPNDPEVHASNVASGWIEHLLLGKPRVSPLDINQALNHARERGVRSAVARLEKHMAKSSHHS